MISKLFPILDQHKDGAPLIDSTYRVLLKIGEGKFAKVKLVYNIEKKEYQAMKILKSTATEVQFKRFVNEIEVMFNINDHFDSKIKILDVNFDGLMVKNGRQPCKVAYYVMDYVEFGELYTILNFDGYKLSRNSIKFLFEKLLKAVQQMHGEGIAHRDLKSENLLLSKDLNIKFCDFGSCIEYNRKFLKPAEFTFKEEEMKEPIGSIEFNAPEVNSIHSDLYDYQKADIFSLGCILFQAVVGSFPFKSSSRHDPFYRRLRAIDTTGYWKIFESEEKHFDKNFKDLIEKMLQFDPDTRIHLQAILEHPWFKQNEVNEQEAEDEINYLTKLISEQFIKDSNEKIEAKNWSRFKGIPMRRSRPGSGNNFRKGIIRFVMENREKLNKLSQKIKSNNGCLMMFKKNLEVTEYRANEDFGVLEKEKEQLSPSRPKTPKKKVFTVTDWLRRCSSSSSFSSSKSNSHI